jgi:ABC-type Na+ transport system ATPase subunit NatA
MIKAVTAMSALLSIDSTRMPRGAELPIGVLSHSESSVALVGQWHSLFEVLAGQLAVSKGVICVSGEDARSRVIKGQLGIATTGFQWPAGCTVAELLELSGRLLGLSVEQSRDEVKRVLQRFDLGYLRKQKLDRLLPMAARKVALAHAMIGSPQFLALEEPLLGLTTHDGMEMVKAIGRAREGRPLIVSVGHATSGSVERVLVDSCDEVLVLRSGVLTLQGPPLQLADGESLFVTTFMGDGDALKHALEQQGLVVRSCLPLPRQEGAPDAQPLIRAVVELAPGQSTRPLFVAAGSCNAALLELRAVSNVE